MVSGSACGQTSSDAAKNILCKLQGCLALPVGLNTAMAASFLTLKTLRFDSIVYEDYLAL